MRELSDKEVFGPTKELSDADVFGTTKPGQLTAANYLQAVKDRQLKDASSATWTDNLRDIVATALKIGPTALKGVADLGRLTTADRVGVDTSNAMKRGMESIDQVVGSTALNAQKASISQALQDPNVGITDLPGVIASNPRAAADTAVSTVGSMFLPTGAAVGATKALPAIAKVFPRLAGASPGAVATGASVATGAAQNAADTFVDTEGQSMGDRYKGAGISGAASLVLGKLLGGGAEGLVARRLAGESGAQGAAAIAKSAVKTGAKEFTQEGGEESSNYVGKQVASHQPIDPSAMGKQGLYGGIVGLGVGSGADVATNVADLRKGGVEREVARAINEAAQNIADRETPQVVQQTVARIFDKMPERQAPAAEAKALPYDPSVRNPQPTMQVDPQGNASPIPSDQLHAIQAETQRMSDLGLTPDVQRAAAQRAQTPEPGPVSAPSDLIQRLMGAGWTPPNVSTNAPKIDTSPAPVQVPAQNEQVKATGSLTNEGTNPAANTQPATLVGTEGGAGGSRPSQAAPNPTERYGVGHTSFTEGGKPFKTRTSAQKARKLQPAMRVVKVDGGFALAEKTDKQLAAEAKAAKRIAGMRTGTPGVPMSVHEFIASHGGLSRSVAPDLGIEGNVKVGNRWLYAGQGKGMSIEQATEKLVEAGYISNDDHNTAYDIIRRSVADPQYTPDGWEQVAQARQQAQYEDYLATQKDAAQSEDFDPFTSLAEDGYLEDDSDGTGFWEADAELQAEVSALSAQLEALGIEPHDILESIVRENANATQDQYNELAKQALTEAIAKATKPASHRDSVKDDGQASTAREAGSPEPKPSPKPEPQTDEGLTSYTPQEVEQRLEKLEQAEKERQRQEREAEQKAKADAERDDFTLTGSDRPADVAASRGQQDIFSAAPNTKESGTEKPVSETRTAKHDPAPQPATKIEDFGEKIGGARKDVWTSFQDDLGAVADDDIAGQPLTKVWPQPDYQALLDGGADPWSVAFARSARGEIPSKPRVAWKVKRWAEQVRSLRDMTLGLMDGRYSVEKTKDELRKMSTQSRGMYDLGGRVELYMMVGHRQSLDGVRISSGEYSVYNGVEYKPAKVIWTVEKSASATAFSNWPRQLATGSTKEEALKAFKERYDSIDINPAAKKETTFEVYSRRGKDGYWVGKKMGRNPIFLAGPFESIKAARDYKANNQAELVEKLAKAKEVPNERRDSNEPRVGEDMRNGQDVTPTMFGESFGFRGVEFGNWVEQGRRQKDLNDAYDALMDMAAILNVPPKALSLDGELGLAFGARGSGGVNPAAAHYERGKVVINLTKKSGAGSLGHEWWHALDNYFSRSRAKPDGMMTDALDVSLASRGSPFQHQGAVRKEMIEAFGSVMKAIRETAIKARSKKLDDKRSKEYWTTDPEMSARAFESYLISKLQDQDASNDYLANIVSPETWKAAEAIGFELEDSYPYPTAGEIPAIRAGFDKFFETIETRETDKGVAIYSENGNGAGISASDAAQVVEDLVKDFGHQPPILIKDSAVSVFPDVTASDRISGATHGGKIYLFLDQIADRPAAVRTLWHELLHYGLRRFLTQEEYVSQMSELYRSDMWVRSEANRWTKTDAGRKAAAYGGEDYARARGVDEALADLAEKSRGDFENKGLFAKAIRNVTDWLAKMADKLNFPEVGAWLRGISSTQARAYVRNVFAKLEKDAPATSSDWAFSADASYSNNTVQSSTEPWNVPEPGAGDAFIRSIQNNKIDVKRVRDAIEEKYGRLADNKDVYLSEELYHGRVAARVTRIYDEQVEPILKKIAVAGKNVGLTMDDVNTYLHARHAPERNAAMKAINPDMKENEALSGMSDAEAAKVLAEFKASGKDKALALIAADVDQLLSDTRTNLVADGLEDAGVVSAWEAAYKHYVPLQRDIKGGGAPKGMGFSVRGPESKRAVGSNREVVNILANVVTQAETAAIRAEKAVVGRTLLAMAHQYPNPEFWKVDIAPTKPRINKDTGLVERSAIDPLYQTADNVVMVKDYGQEHFIVFNKQNDRAMAMAHAMKNLDIAPMNKVFEVINKGTRFLASLLTQRNPLFWLTNFARDAQGVLINLEGTDAEGLQREAMANLPAAFKGMHSVVRGEGKGQWARYAREFEEAGGMTGYMQVFENSDKRMADLEKEVQRMQQGKSDPRRLARLTLDFIDDYNDIVENSVRLAVFQAARDANVSTVKAASIAKNITVNFNRKGNMTPVVNSLYMFFNASVQGTARLAQAMVTSPKARALVGGIAAMGFLMDALNRMAAGDDDETKRNRYDLIPEFEKSRNWIFMNPMRPGEYVKVPLPLGPHVFHNAGRLLSDATFRKDPRNASEYGWSMASTVLDAFSPLGSSPSLGQLVAPSVLDPVVQLTENKSFTGAPVYKSADKGFGKTDPRPAYTRHFDSTPDLWVGASKMLNDVTGGDKVKPGVIDISPDIMKHVFYTMTGGPGRTFDQAIDATQAEARGKELSVNRVPFVSRFYGANDDAQRERAYYDDKKRVLDAKQTFDYYIKNGRQDEARKVATDLGDGDPAKGRKKMMEYSASDKSIRKLNGSIRQELERDDDGTAKAEQLKALRQRRMRVMSNAMDDE